MIQSPRTTWIVLFLLVAALSFFLRSANAQPAASAPEAQDILLLHPRGVLFVRVHIQRDGAPNGQGYQAAWGDFLLDYFESLDRDGDFALEHREFRRGRWSLLAARDPASGFAREAAASMLDFDTSPQDDLVSFTEVVEKLAQSCCQVTYAGQPGRQDALRSDAIFTQLDRDGDRRIDIQERSDIMARLRWLDQNDDELFSAMELQPNTNPMGARRFAGMAGPLPTEPQSPVIAPPPGTPAESFAPLAIKFYAAGEADDLPEYLSRAEAPASLTKFDLLDRDKSGALDAAELSGWDELNLPDTEIVVRLDASLDRQERMQIVESSTPGAGDSPQVSKSESGEVIVSLPTIQIAVSAGGPVDFKRMVTNYKQQFQAVDADNNDYLEPNEAIRMGIREEFAAMDADRNGQLFIEELVEYRRRETETAQARTDINVSNRGSTLFEILETSRDGRLSSREMSMLGQFADKWDRDNDQAVSTGEIPQKYQFAVQPGRPRAGNSFGFVVATATNGRVRPTARRGDGPDWFHRMDRNGDGDLSRREFLGPIDDFRRWDLDADGLLSPSEAAGRTAREDVATE